MPPKKPSGPSPEPAPGTDQVRERLRKLDELRALGVDPYAGKITPTHLAQELHDRHGALTAEQLAASPVACTVAGRIVGLRSFGKAAFAHLLDRSGRIQIYAKGERLDDLSRQVMDRLDLGDWIGAQGRLFRTKTGELTVEAERLTLLTKTIHPLPEKWHGLTDVEQRYRQRYLDLISNPEARRVFLERSRIIDLLRRRLIERGFQEVETPMMQSVAGGALARPFVTHHNALGIDLFLRIAPELHLKRLVIGGLERVFEINRNFRNEGVSTQHNPEFTMLEFYQAHADYEQLMTFTEELLTGVLRELRGSLTVTYQGRPLDFTPPWPRLAFLDALAQETKMEPAALRDRTELLKLARRHAIPADGKHTTGQLQAALFDALVEERLTGPVFIVDHPKDVSPLAKAKPERPELVQRFELYLAGMEVANAFTELNDPAEQRARFEYQAAQRRAGDQEAHPIDEDYLRALEFGLPPTAGEGIGIDRLVMILTDQPSIRDVILFPQLRPEKT
ncbi:MAG: lysine--tRNA ligase [Nitrospirota bacterium]